MIAIDAPMLCSAEDIRYPYGSLEPPEYFHRSPRGGCPFWNGYRITIIGGMMTWQCERYSLGVLSRELLGIRFISTLELPFHHFVLSNRRTLVRWSVPLFRCCNRTR